nr:hypothetical protein BgiMline_028930 [Biomphalaria glabrata]
MDVNHFVQSRSQYESYRVFSHGVLSSQEAVLVSQSFSMKPTGVTRLILGLPVATGDHISPSSYNPHNSSKLSAN